MWRSGEGGRRDSLRRTPGGELEDGRSEDPDPEGSAEGKKGLRRTFTHEIQKYSF